MGNKGIVKGSIFLIMLVTTLSVGSWQLAYGADSEGAVKIGEKTRVEGFSTDRLLIDAPAAILTVQVVDGDNISVVASGTPAQLQGVSSVVDSQKRHVISSEFTSAGNGISIVENTGSVTVVNGVSVNSGAESAVAVGLLPGTLRPCS